MAILCINANFFRGFLRTIYCFVCDLRTFEEFNFELSAVRVQNKGGVSEALVVLPLDRPKKRVKKVKNNKKLQTFYNLFLKTA